MARFSFTVGYSRFDHTILCHQFSRLQECVFPQLTGSTFEGLEVVTTCPEGIRGFSVGVRFPILSAAASQAETRHPSAAEEEKKPIHQMQPPKGKAKISKKGQTEFRVMMLQKLESMGERLVVESASALRSSAPVSSTSTTALHESVKDRAPSSCITSDPDVQLRGTSSSPTSMCHVLSHQSDLGFHSVHQSRKHARSGQIATIVRFCASEPRRIKVPGREARPRPSTSQ